MALSGSTNRVFTNNGSLRLEIDWTATQSIPENFSRVTATLSLKGLYSWSTIYSGSVQKAVSININGNNKKGTSRIDIKGTEKRALISHTVNVPHNAEGYKNFSISGALDPQITWNGGWVGNTTISGSWTLNPIARMAGVKVTNSGLDFGANLNYTLSGTVSSFSYQTTVTVAGQSVNQNIAGASATGTKSINIPASWIPKVTNSASTNGVIKVVTKSGSTVIGTNTATFNVKVPANIVPTLTSTTTKEVNAKVSKILGVTTTHVQDFSKIEVTVAGAGVQGSTIKQYIHTVNKVEYNTDKPVFILDLAKINAGTGNVTVTSTVVDSRGRKASKNTVVSILPYKIPKISTLTIARTDEGKGGEVLVTRTGVVSSLKINNVEKNPYTATVKYKKSGAKEWTTGSTTYNTFTTITIPNIAVNATYDFLVELKDQLSKAEAGSSVPTANTLFSLVEDKGIGIGKVRDKGILDVRGDVHLEGSLNMANKPIVKQEGNNININAVGQDIVLGKENTRFVNIAKPTDVMDLMDIWKVLRIRGGGKVVFNGAGDNGQGVSMNHYGNVKFSSGSTSNQWLVQDNKGNTLFQVQNDGGNGSKNRASSLRIGTDGTGKHMACLRVWDRTYSIAPNVVVTDWGTIGRSTSASKYKLNITPVENYHYRNVLNLEVKTWFDKSATEQHADYLTKKSEIYEVRVPHKEKENMVQELNEEYKDVPVVEAIYGLIAEDVKEAGLEEYVSYRKNPETNEKEIEGIQYDRLVVPLIELAKEHDKKILDLEAQVSQLTELVTELLKKQIDTDTQEL